MDYSDSIYHNTVTSLTKQEIVNPYLVIDELYKKRTMERFHADLRVIQGTLYKEREWMKYNPIDLYTTYEDMIRLLDTLYLINKYNPEISTALDTSTSIKSDNKKMNTINRVFKKMPPEPQQLDEHKEKSSITVLSTIYSIDSLQFLKDDIFNCLQISLDASYMGLDKYEYFGGNENDYALIFSTLEDLITEMYQIHLKKTSIFPNSSSCKEAGFATDSDHLKLLTDDIIETPYSSFLYFYYYDLNYEHIHNALNSWKQILFEKDIWKKEQNPGNLLYLNQRLIKQIEVMWLLFQNKQLKHINESYIAKKRYKKLINICNTEELNNPINVIENFMAYKKSHEWKSLLYKWLKCSLDNDHNYPVDDKDQIDAEFNQLIKFTEAVLLLSLSRLPKKSNK